MQLEVLADDKITETEVKELTTLYTECLEKAGGIEYTVDVFYQVSTGFQSGIMTADGPMDDQGMIDAYNNKESECRKTTVGGIGALYAEIAMNPQKVDFDEVYSACWVRRGVVPEDFTTEDYKNYYKQLEAANAEIPDVSHDKDGNPIWGAEQPFAELPLPGGASLSDERVESCDADPRPEAD
jgi:hypothetical protein